MRTEQEIREEIKKIKDMLDFYYDEHTYCDCGCMTHDIDYYEQKLSLLLWVLG